MSCSEKDSDEVDSQHLPNLDSEADAMGCSEKDSDEVDSERLPDLDSEAGVCATQNDKNELHMSSQKDTQHTQTLRAKYLKTDQMDEEEKEVNNSENELKEDVNDGLSVAYVFQIMDASGNHKQHPHHEKPSRYLMAKCSLCHHMFSHGNKARHLKSNLCLNNRLNRNQ